MFEQKIKIAQNDSVTNGLATSENELNELNKELDSLTQEYANNITAPEASFFNFDNPYFWFVLGGLLIVSLALFFLILELKKPRKAKEKVGKIKFDSKKEVKIENIHRVDRDYEAEERARHKPKGPIKIKVLKVK